LDAISDCCWRSAATSCFDASSFPSNSSNRRLRAAWRRRCRGQCYYFKKYFRPTIAKNGRFWLNYGHLRRKNDLDFLRKAPIFVETCEHNIDSGFEIPNV
jgi:hypothetical protein